MSMFLLEGSSHRSCNLASECRNVCWLCGLVCVRSCVLVGMCRQRCTLIVARCACACACMSARVNVCSWTTGLDLTTTSGDHRARAPTTRPRLCVVRQRPLPPRPNVPICSSRRPFAQARAPTARVLWSTPLPRFRAPRDQK